jgi:aldehyde:ferredoxin oxidoreductase
MSARSKPLSDFVGKILRINLTEGKWVEQGIKPETVQSFLGGIGLASKILFEETGPQSDPLGPENIVIVSAGLLDGLDAPTAYRTEVTTKSPLTGLVGSGSAGGGFGSNLRRAGFESIVIGGRSEKPVYLVIQAGQVDLREAGHLWGKDTWETTAALKQELGEDFSVMAIGQAGENQVRFACPVFDCHHAPGRCHAGAVLGNKRLKAIAVHGTRQIPLCFPDRFKEVAKEIEKRIVDYPERGLRQEVGSIYKVVSSARKESMPARNFQQGFLPPSSDLWRPEEYKRHITKGPLYCGKCALASYYGCNATADIREGKHKGSNIPGIGFSFLMWQWAGECAIEDFPTMAKCREMCNRYGMDEAGPIPFALELYQRKILRKEDLDGKELNWGDGEAILDLISQIAHRRGIGDILAEGSLRASKIIGRGAGKYALTIKGMEMMDAPDPRAGGRAKQLGNMTCVRGGDDVKTTHTIFERMPDWAVEKGMNEGEYAQWFLERLDMAEDIKKEIYGDPPTLDSSRYSARRVALMAKWYEDLSFVRDSLGICLFAVQTTSAIGSSYSARLLAACSGWEISPAEIMRIGERIQLLLKAYNVREGWTKAADDYPDRFFSDPLEKSAGSGAVLSKEALHELLEAYYEVRGGDEKTGVPRREKFVELGLDWAARELFDKKRPPGEGKTLPRGGR